MTYKGKAKKTALPFFIFRRGKKKLCGAECLSRFVSDKRERATAKRHDLYKHEAEHTMPYSLRKI